MSWRDKLGRLADRFRLKDGAIQSFPDYQTKFSTIEKLMFEGKYNESLKYLRDIESSNPSIHDQFQCELLKGYCLLQIGEFRTSKMLAHQIVESSRLVEGMKIISID
ncbi:MAG: hypothetical protein ACTSQZ_03335, partial [Candidatus Thorarchaeota archaeon]